MAGAVSADHDGLRGFALVLLLAIAACGGKPEAPPTPASGAASPVDEAEPERERPTFLKGQLHCHSNASGDSDTPVAEVVRWYAEKGYDFIVLTDHNRITESAEGEGMLVLPGIELTQNLPTCEPAPEDGMQCLLHVNALVVDSDKAAGASQLPQPSSFDRVELYGHAVRVSDQLGGVAQLNHPNFHYAADARVIGMVAKRGLTLLEVRNEAFDSNNGGDAEHPNTELVWDDVLASGARVWATATDDAHHYYDAEDVAARGEPVFTGDRGWVMVRAERDAKSIRQALRDGKFYASNGVTLFDVIESETTLTVEVAPESPGDHTIRFIGSGGKILDETTGRRASFDVGSTRSKYVRAVVEDTEGHRAWTQPLFKTAGGRS